jgi:HAD superfamily hydrolase (TIGR01549 family)
MSKLFIWDFHGTLEKGNEHAALEISNAALAKHGFSQRFTYEHAISLYGKKWYEYFEFLLPDEPHETHIMLQQTSFEWPDAFEVIAKHMKPNDHVPQVLEAIRRKGHQQVVISNTSTDALPKFLELARIDGFFNDNTAFAVMAHAREVKRSKIDVVNDYLARLDPKPEIIVIGDSEKDMLLAEQLGAKGYWYRHPHHPVPEIVRKDPNLVAINDLRGVLAEL